MKACRLTYESVSFDLRVCIVYICFYYFFCPFFPALTILLTVSLTKESLSAFVLSNLTVKNLRQSRRLEYVNRSKRVYLWTT